MWCTHGKREMIELQNFFLFKFTSPQDLDLMRAASPWKISDHHLVLTNWAPNFDPLIAVIKQIPVWIMLPGLPMEYWVADHRRKIVKPTGNLIRMDEVTLSKGRATNRAMFARVLVDMDLTSEIPEGVYIHSPEGNRFQKFTVENPPPKCATCRKFVTFAATCTS